MDNGEIFYENVIFDPLMEIPAGNEEVFQFGQNLKKNMNEMNEEPKDVKNKVNF